MQEPISPEDRLRLLDAVCACSSFAQVADRLLDPIASALSASSCVFLEFVERPGIGVDIDRRSYVGAQRWSMDLYAERYFRSDPLVARVLAFFGSAENDETPIVGALPATEAMRESEYYSRFLRPSDIEHVAGLTVPFRSGFGPAMLCLGFHRRNTDAPFGAVELGLLEQLSPVVRLVLSRLAAREALPLSGALVELISRGRRGTGYLVLDEDLLVLHAGGCALEDLGIAPSDSGIAASNDSLLGELRGKLLSKPPRTGDPPQGFLLERRGNAFAIGIEAQAVATGEGQRILVTTSMADPASQVAVGDRYGLSARESEVAWLVCAGSSNGEIARALGIALRTVENHLRSIYGKLCVSSRTRLVARLLL
jgi:DNA-binding CsgD family transcriptional regulator